jgi:hypothetical protein
METTDLDKLTPHDRDEVIQFMGFLQGVGRVPKGDPEEHRKLREWIAADREERLRYLGFTPEEGERLLRVREDEGLRIRPADVLTAPGGREGETHE